MKYAYYLDSLVTHAIGNDVGCAGNHQFPRARNSSSPAKSREIAQVFNGFLDGNFDSRGGHRIIPADIVRLRD